MRTKKTIFKWKTIHGLKQNPPDHDFHITPVLTFARNSKELRHIGKAWGICLEWGHWAVGFAVYTTYIPPYPHPANKP